MNIAVVLVLDSSPAREWRRVLLSLFPIFAVIPMSVIPAYVGTALHRCCCSLTVSFVLSVCSFSFLFGRDCRQLLFSITSLTLVISSLCFVPVAGMTASVRLLSDAFRSVVLRFSSICSSKGCGMVGGRFGRCWRHGRRGVRAARRGCRLFAVRVSVWWFLTD